MIQKNLFLLILIKRGYSLIGKTANLHIVNLGSSPDISINYIYILFFMLEKLNWSSGTLKMFRL